MAATLRAQAEVDGRALNIQKLNGFCRFGRIRKAAEMARQCLPADLRIAMIVTPQPGRDHSGCALAYGTTVDADHRRYGLAG
jgi:hypothetical protein